MAVKMVNAKNPGIVEATIVKMCENSSVFYFSMISFQTGFSAMKNFNVKIQGKALKSSQNS